MKNTSSMRSVAVLSLATIMVLSGAANLQARENEVRREDHRADRREDRQKDKVNHRADDKGSKAKEAGDDRGAHGAGHK
jgi:hypothetical protein